MAVAQRRDSQGCRRGWSSQRSAAAAAAAAAGRSGDCMFGYVAVKSLDTAAVALGEVDVEAEVVAAETAAAAQSVDAVGGDREEAAAIAIRPAVEEEGKLDMAVAVAAAATVAEEEEEETLGMAVVTVVAGEEEDQEEAAGNTARLELDSASRN